jgi:flavin reductase (DIM6/NTAB) family NADH-FMN oxidoreductase RutF
MKTTNSISSDGPPVTMATLRRVAGTFATGVTAVTTLVDGRPHGCVANAVASLSLEPPLMLLCLAHTSRTHSHLMKSRQFGINILDDSPESRALCRAFSRQSEDRFMDVEFCRGLIGVPILALAMSWLECELVDAYDSGDHTIFIGRVLAAEETDRQPLVFFRGKFGSLSVDLPRE